MSGRRARAWYAARTELSPRPRRRPRRRAPRVLDARPRSATTSRKTSAERRSAPRRRLRERALQEVEHDLIADVDPRAAVAAGLDARAKLVVALSAEALQRISVARRLAAEPPSCASAPSARRNTPRRPRREHDDVARRDAEGVADGDGDRHLPLGRDPRHRPPVYARRVHRCPDAPCSPCRRPSAASGAARRSDGERAQRRTRSASGGCVANRPWMPACAAG